MRAGSGCLRIVTAVVLAAVAVVVPASAQDTAGVQVHDNHYEPVRVEIEAGDSVSWIHVGANPHTITTQPGAQRQFDAHPNCDSPTDGFSCMNPGERYERRLDQPGSYPYYCKLHGQADVPPDPSKGPEEQPCGMCGLVVVTGAAPTATPTTAPTPTATATPRPTPAARTTASPSPSPSPSPTPSPTPEPTAAPTPTPEEDEQATPPAEDDDGGDGAGARAATVALAAIMLAGAGILSWRSLLRGR